MEPGMCVMGCGFFGTANNQNMCSRCYADFLKSKIVVDRAALDKRRDQILPPTKNDAGLTAVMKGMTVQDSEKKRCDKCKKKAGVTGHGCRCGGLFCEKHRLPEQHTCNFDFRAHNNNGSRLPLIKADKLEHRI